LLVLLCRLQHIDPQSAPETGHRETAALLAQRCAAPRLRSATSGRALPAIELLASAAPHGSCAGEVCVCGALKRVAEAAPALTVRPGSRDARADARTGAAIDVGATDRYDILAAISSGEASASYELEAGAVAEVFVAVWIGGDALGIGDDRSNKTRSSVSVW